MFRLEIVEWREKEMYMKKIKRKTKKYKNKNLSHKGHFSC